MKYMHLIRATLSMVRAFRRIEVVKQTPARYFTNQPNLGFIRKTSTVKSSYFVTLFGQSSCVKQTLFR
jgi:hypothetical protein